MILLIDNYDSFTYNLVQFCGSVNPDIKVVRNDEITVDEIKKLAPSHIILSPGPGYPKDAGICEEVIKKLAVLFTPSVRSFHSRPPPSTGRLLVRYYMPRYSS